MSGLVAKIERGMFGHAPKIMKVEKETWFYDIDVDERWKLVV